MKKHIGKILIISIASITAIIYVIITLNIEKSSVLTSKSLPKNNNIKIVNEVTSNEMAGNNTNVIKDNVNNESKSKSIPSKKEKQNNNNNYSSSNGDLDIKSKIIEKEAVNELD